jgi:hypothetical protein
MRTVARLRPHVSAALALLLVTLSVAVPMLDRADAGSGVVVESEHHPGTCPPAHDHTVCTQFGGNLPLVSAWSRIPSAATVRTPPLHDDLRLSHTTVSVAANRSRAPPSV